MNASSLVGHPSPGFFARSLGVVHMKAVCLATVGNVTTSSIVVIAVLYGYAAGIYIGLEGPLIAFLTPDISELGAHLGMTYTFRGLPNLPTKAWKLLSWRIVTVTSPWRSDWWLYCRFFETLEMDNHLTQVLLFMEPSFLVTSYGGNRQSSAASSHSLARAVSAGFFFSLKRQKKAKFWYDPTSQNRLPHPVHRLLLLTTAHNLAHSQAIKHTLGISMK